MSIFFSVIFPNILSQSFSIFIKLRRVFPDNDNQVLQKFYILSRLHSLHPLFPLAFTPRILHNKEKGTPAPRPIPTRKDVLS